MATGDGANARLKVLIIGGGAAGIFTAYELAKRSPGLFDVTILEADEESGGHTRGRELSHDGDSMHVDCGAQFFYESSEKEYCDLLAAEGFLGPGGDVTLHTAGMTVFDATTGKLTIRVPSTDAAIIRAALRHPITFLRLKRFIRAADEFFEEGDWDLSFGEWIDGLDLGWPRGGQDAFKASIVRPLMYQFGLVPPEELDALSALFVIYYFVTSLPRKEHRSRSGDEPSGTKQAFKLYCVKQGMDGVLRELIDRHGLSIEKKAPVRSIKPLGEGWQVQLDQGRTRDADEVVFATNPMRTLEILPDTPDHAEIRGLLSRMPYAFVPVHVQAGDSAFMPDDPSDWELANVRVLTDGKTGKPTHYMMTAWFGPVRDRPIGRRFFKSWGSPRLEPHDAPRVAIRVHELMVGTPDFIRAREQLIAEHQGRRHLWFAGGWSIDYDTQNSSLKSAKDVAKGLAASLTLEFFEGIDVPPRSPELRREHPIESETTLLRWL